MRHYGHCPGNAVVHRCQAVTIRANPLHAAAILHCCGDIRVGVSWLDEMSRARPLATHFRLCRRCEFYRHIIYSLLLLIPAGVVVGFYWGMNP